MREAASFCMFFEKFRASKLEIDDPKPPKKRKVLSYYEKGEAQNLYLQLRSTFTKFLSQQKYYIDALQAIEILLLKVFREEDFGLEHLQYLRFLAIS